MAESSEPAAPAWLTPESVRGFGRAPGGLVAASVDGSGSPHELTIQPAAMGLSPAELAAQVIAALRVAHADATQQVHERMQSDPLDEQAVASRAAAAAAENATAEVRRMSAQVTEQLEDVFGRLNKLMGTFDDGPRQRH